MMKCAEDEILNTTEAITTTPTEEERQKEHEKEEAPRWRPRRKCGRPGNVTEALLDRGPKTPENPRKHAASLYRRPKSDRHIKRPLLHRHNGDGRKISQRGQREEKKKTYYFARFEDEIRRSRYRQIKAVPRKLSFY